MVPNNDNSDGTDRIIDDGDVVEQDKVLKRKIIELTESKKDPRKSEFTKVEKEEQSDNSDDD